MIIFQVLQILLKNLVEKLRNLKVMKNNNLKFYYEIKCLFLPLSDFKDKIRTLENYNYYFMHFISDL